MHVVGCEHGDDRCDEFTVPVSEFAADIAGAVIADG